MANPYASHKNDYLRNQVMSASPNKLIEMLIEGAIKSIKKAEMAIEDKKIEAANNEIVHAQDIVDDVVEQELIQANIHKDKNHLEIASTMLNELLDAWKQITK